ncbi:MAG: hypothetical protein WC261_06745 [Synergistaceae bacterium]|jgi:hypothetical protein
MSKDFSFTITSEQLTRGLRPSSKAPRDSKFLVESKGAIGEDGVLCAIDELTRLATTEVTDTFPFPQLFVFTNLILVCGRLKIYELVSGALSLKYTASTSGSTWTAVDFYNYVYLSNGREAVTRNPDTGVYSISSTLPKGMSICNFNGQVLVGAPDAVAEGASLSVKVGILSLNTSQSGSWS